MLKNFIEKGVVIKTNKDGFILLFAILSISFLLAITVNLADSLYKQHKFLSFSSESLDALNNSNAGLECAMYWDRKFDAFNTTKSTDIYCGRQKFTVGNQEISEFTLLNDDGTQSTDVEVDKRVTGTTTITASGYNTKAAAENRVSRELVVSYADRQVSNKCADFDIVLVLDISSSLSGQERIDSANAAKIIVDNLQFGPTLAQMGVIWFFALSDVQLPLSTNPTNIKNAIDYSYKNVVVFGDTNLPWALMNAKNELLTHGRPNAPDFVVLVTDGETNECSSPSGGRVYCPGETTLWSRWKSMKQSTEYATTLKDAGITIITVGVALQHQAGSGDDDVTVQEYKDFLGGIATRPNLFSVVDDASHLHEITEGFDCSFFSRVRGTPIIKEQ